MDNLEYLAQELNKRVEEMAEALANGAAKSHEEYQLMVGMVRGVRFAIGKIADIHEMQLRGDADD